MAADLPPTRQPGPRVFASAPTFPLMLSIDRFILPKCLTLSARVPGSIPGRPCSTLRPELPLTFWNAVAAHPWPGGCGVRGPPPRSSNWDPTCCRPPPAGASAGSSRSGLSPVERPGGRGLQGARAAARRRHCRGPRPTEGRGLRGRGVAKEEGGWAGRYQGPPLRSLCCYGSAGSAGMERS